MKYPAFRLKVVLNMAIVITLSITLQIAIEQIANAEIYGTPNFAGILLLQARMFLSSVLPPLVIMSAITLWYLHPLHRVVLALSKGETPEKNEYFKARKVIIHFPYLIIGLSVSGFLIGNILGSRDFVALLTTLLGLGALAQQLTTGALFAFIVISINRTILAAPRAMLQIYYIDQELEHPERDLNLRTRNSLLIVFLAAYLILSMIIVNRYIRSESELYVGLLESVVKNEMSIEEAAATYRREIAANPTILSSVDQIEFPFYKDQIERPRPLEVQFTVFLILLIIAFLVQFTSDTAQVNQLKRIKRRLTEILDDEGDLTDRVEIGQFDEIGEISDRFNRLMDKLNERNRQERELRLEKETSEASLAMAQKVAHLGSFEKDLVKNTISISDELRRMLSIEQSETAASSDVLFDTVHPDDVEAVTGKVADAVAGGSSYLIPEYRVILAGERERVFQQRGEVQTDDSGRPVRLFGTILDITQRKAAERDIMEKETALHAAEAASRAKSAFLANMSHELRTPLNSVIAASDILLEKYFGDLTEKQDDYLKDIRDSGRHLLSLINDILDLSKIEAGYSPLELDEVEIGSLLEGSLTIVKEKAMKHGIGLTAEVPSDLPTVVADERKLKQVVYNLLSNAVKFTPDGGNVGIKATLQTELLEVCVWDTGIGISVEDQAEVFGEFAQAEATLTKKFEGTGLGLAIVKSFIEQHEGEVWVKSAPGEGSQFYFTLPLRPIEE